MMRWSYDQTVDSLYVHVHESQPVSRTVEVRPGRLLFDLDDGGELIGLEIVSLMADDPAQALEAVPDESVREYVSDVVAALRTHQVQTHRGGAVPAKPGRA